ncbi:MAG: CapA family protein, partial [Blautia sp.]|nr:CapA family protein [Blautia sp.]
MEKMNARVSMAVATVLLVLICILFNRLDYVMVRKPASEASAEEKVEEAQTLEEGTSSLVEENETRARVVAFGDNFIYGNGLTSGTRDDGTYSFTHLYSRLQGDIQGADLAILTQEAPLSADESQVTGDYPYVNPAQLAKDLASVGFDAVGISSEYMAMSGESLIGETVRSMAPMAVVGAHQGSEGASYQVVNAGDIKVGLVNFCMPIVGRTTGASSSSSDEDGYYGSDGTYYLYNDETGEYEAQTSQSSTASSAYELDLFNTKQVSQTISTLKQRADCIICLAHFGAQQEAMPTEYQKEWVTYLMQQGVDVGIGSYTHCLAPYGAMQQGGKGMLVYYGLGNFVSTGDTLDKLLGGMAQFTIKKTVSGGKTTISIENYDLIPLVMHYSYKSGEFAVYKLSDYTDELCDLHSAKMYSGLELSKSLLDRRSEEILSMNVSPSEKTYLLDAMVDEDGNYYD